MRIITASKVLLLLAIVAHLHASDPGPLLLIVVIFSLPIIAMPGMALGAIVVANTGRWSQLNWAFVFSLLAILPTALLISNGLILHLIISYVLISIAATVYISLRICLVKRMHLIPVIFIPHAIILLVVGILFLAGG